jgi:hypothetical protein
MVQVVTKSLIDLSSNQPSRAVDEDEQGRVRMGLPVHHLKRLKMLTLEK